MVNLKAESNANENRLKYIRNTHAKESEERIDRMKITLKLYMN